MKKLFAMLLALVGLGLSLGSCSSDDNSDEPVISTPVTNKTYTQSPPEPFTDADWFASTSSRTTVAFGGSTFSYESIFENTMSDGKQVTMKITFSGTFALPVIPQDDPNSWKVPLTYKAGSLKIEMNIPTDLTPPAGRTVEDLRAQMIRYVGLTEAGLTGATIDNFYAHTGEGDTDIGLRLPVTSTFDDNNFALVR